MLRLLMCSFVTAGVAWVTPRSGVRRLTLPKRVASPEVEVPPAPTSSLDGTWDRDAWLAGFRTPERELSVPITCTDLPADLVGTYYRNGPGKFEVFDDQVMHPADADSMVTAATFIGNGTLYFRNRFIRTKGYQQELRQGKSLYSGKYGTPKPVWAGGGKIKHVANMNIMWWAGRILALWDSGQPYKLDPLSLGTAGATDLGTGPVGNKGALGPMVSENDGLAARIRIDPVKNRLCCFDYAANPVGGTSLRLLEFDKEFRPAQPVQSRSIPSPLRPLPGSYACDSVLTQDWVVFTASAQKQAATGIGALLGGAETDASGASDTYLVLFRRDGSDGGKPRICAVDSHFNLHNANGYQDENGHVIIDSVRADQQSQWPPVTNGKPVWETVDFEKDVSKSTLWRYVVDVSGAGSSNGDGSDMSSGARLVSSTELCRRCLSFPVINPAVSTLPYRYTWALTGSKAEGASPMQGIIKVDTQDPLKHQVWMPEPHEFCGEPAYAARAGSEGTSPSAEDDGYIMSIIMDGKSKESSLIVLNAKDITKGPIARVPLGVNIPHGMHGCFVPEVAPSLAELNDARVLLAMYERKSKEWNQVDAGFSGLGIAQFFGQKGVDGR